jgi:oligopeptidase B
MRDTSDPDLIAYLHAENEHADAWFAPHHDTIETIFGEIRSRVQETDVSVPVAHGDWWYVTRTVEELSYPIHSRGATRDTAADHTVLDENAEADGHDYFDLGAFDVSHDHTLLAWSADLDGNEHYTMRIRDLGSGAELDDVLVDTANAGVAWSVDSSHLFYVTADEQERPFRVWRHRLGTPQSADVVVYEDLDERFYVGVSATRSDRWIVMGSGSKTSSEAWLLPTDDPLGELRCVRPRADDVEYSVDDWGDVLVQVTNRDAVDFRVLTAPVDADWPSDDAWSELVEHVAGRRVVGVDPFAGHLVLHEWADAQPRLRILFRDGSERTIHVSDEPHDVDLAGNPEWTSGTVRFGTQSLTSPATIFDEDVTSGRRELLRRVPTPNVDLDAYRSLRVWATSTGGVQVPLDIVHHVDTPLDGTAPATLYAYGSYEASMPPWFSVARLSLLDRGHVWALAHPRGGGELGRQWYLDGKLLAKQHTFDDMIACAEHLVAGLTDPHRLAIRGGSAGGLLVGACMTQRPDLFASVVAEVPFVDVVSTMSDPTLPLTITEWDEWGDPRSEPFASAMLAYSPYDNTTAREYPALYATAGLNDPRVSVHEPAKWVARLREVTTGDAPIVLRTEMGAGHGGPTGRYDMWRDEARTLAFLLATLAPAG